MLEGVEEFITKPFFLKDLVRRTKKVIDRLQLEKLQKRAVRPGVIQGRLEEMSILDLMQSLEMGQKSCQLTIRHGDETCELFFASGQCTDARLGATEGEAAVFQAVRWPAGEFEIDFNGAPTRSTISRTTTGLLMEALRLMDEGQRDGDPAEVPKPRKASSYSRRYHARFRSYSQRFGVQRQDRRPLRPVGGCAMQRAGLGDCFGFRVCRTIGRRSKPF